MSGLVWRHLNDNTECVAGRFWCDHHSDWECAQSHDALYPSLSAPTTPDHPVSPVYGDPGGHSDGQER